MKFISFLSALALLLPFMVTAQQDININWRILPDAEYIDREVEAGGVITFNWDEDEDFLQNVWEFPNKKAFEACDFLEADNLVDASIVGTLDVETDEADEGTGRSKKGNKKRYFGCQVGLLCIRGHMKIVVNVI
jgi:hypothetical protein